MERDIQVTRSDNSDDTIVVDGIALPLVRETPEILFSFPSSTQRLIINAYFFPERDSLYFYHFQYMTFEKRCRGVKR